MRLKYKTAIITGSTRGIGYSIAESFAKEGCNLVITGRSQEKVHEVTDYLSSNYSVEVLGVACDVSDAVSSQNMIKQSLDRFDTIDILINNAGMTDDNLFLRMGESQWTNVIETNLNSVFYVTKPLVRHMLKKKYGKIINISSVVGVIGNAGQANYSASKAGIIGFTKSLAKELGGKGIFCNAVAPGFIKTDMTNSLPEDMLNTIIESIPIKRLGNTDDISQLLLFLASDESNYITGQVISIDGGMNI